MKEALTFIGLVILSILYLFEVDFSQIGVLNWIAFVIIALTLVPLAFQTISVIVKKSKEKKQAAEQKIQKE